MPGMDQSRADIIVTGAVVLDTLLQRTGVKELVLCEWALREGILLDYMQGHRRSVARAEAYPDVRRRSVASLAERCAADDEHGKHVARLALELFEATRRLHGLGDEARSLLEYAALLHDIGHHISYPGHHKHTYYLIKNGRLRGFHPIEIEVARERGPLPPPWPPAEEARGLRRHSRRTPGAPCARWPPSCAWPTRSTAATGGWCAA